ncbi:MAG TPA: exodeoxyribonuclease VII large subunit [Candidatus Saccharimonas sp.]|nr:exodeoxyribonuclease VII large subunit [Candidatus Saccharimonas sp.]
MELPILSVSQLIAVVNQTLEFAYPSIIVEGEVASFKVSKNKFVFFDLKDDEGVVNCFMMIYQLRHALEDGMRIKIVAQPRLTAWGKFSLTVREVMPVGEGNIKRAFELLRAKLSKEGLFDPARKRPLPRVPQRIGLIASVESAGYVDFLKILDARWGDILIEVADVQVQGMSAAAQIVSAIEHFNQTAELPEVLVVVRGGGSADDLAVFNDEALVRAIAASRVPTLVGVGHEVDTSLADLAADVRAATPSNAAQLLAPDRHAITRELDQREHRLYQRLEHQLTDVQRLLRETPQLMLARLESAVVEHKRRIHHAEQLLKQLDPSVVLRRGYALVHVNNKLVKKANDVKTGDLLTIALAHAILKAEVIHVSTKR